MQQIDQYSYQCGVMDTFAEMVKAGVKKLALAHPWKSQMERARYLPFVASITKEYHIHYYLDDDPLITDLFPASMNKNTYNIIFYQNEADILAYQECKKIKQQALDNKQYEQIRLELANTFGLLLGYPKETIERYIQENNEKEVF